MDDRAAGLLGASSMVGGCAIPLLARDGRHVFAYSRKVAGETTGDVTWQGLSSPFVAGESAPIGDWISLMPIWQLPQYFPMLEACGARRVVALSSTSRFTKKDSSSEAEQRLATNLEDGEAQLKAWAESRGVEWVVLRPTLIYGLGQDKNIAEIARIICRFGFFPLLGRAAGLRQPVHVEDVASACVAALGAPAAANRAYNISGGETLTYREMAERVFIAMRRRPRLVTVPLAIFRLAVACMRVLPGYRGWTVAMAERMNQDLVFDHSDAASDFNFSPRPFNLALVDVPG